MVDYEKKKTDIVIDGFGMRGIGMSEARPKEILKLGKITKLAMMMHERYEIIAREEGWITQETTRVSFGQLPEANRKTMLRLAEEIIEFFDSIDG